MRLTPSAEELQTIKKLNLRDPWIWLATWGGHGFMKPAPGTWGSVGALPFAVIFHVLGGPFLLLIAIIALYFLGLRATEKFQKQTGTQDSAMIVVDEVVGQWIPLLAFTMDPFHVLISFIFFRFFDIVKPWPVSWCDQKLPGAKGVMLDDVAAGLYALLCVIGLQYAGLG